MTDYISREAVKQIIAAQCGECADACLEFDGIQPDCNQCLLHGVLKELATIPAADVRPVVRGKWVEELHPNVRYYQYKCSICGKFSGHDSEGWIWKPNFCPECGADMRETQDEKA
jgi:hypothetical protein